VGSGGSRNWVLLETLVLGISLRLILLRLLREVRLRGGHLIILVGLKRLNLGLSLLFLLAGRNSELLDGDGHDIGLSGCGFIGSLLLLLLEVGGGRGSLLSRHLLLGLERSFLLLEAPQSHLSDGDRGVLETIEGGLLLGLEPGLVLLGEVICWQ